MTAARTVILGGGLAGLSAAHDLGDDAVLYEHFSSLGGLCRQVRIEGFQFDAVPHVLHFQHTGTRAFIERLLEGRVNVFARQARVYSHGTFIRYPFQAHLYGLPAPVVEECVEARLHASRARAVDTSNFERWIFTTLGSGIARHFMVPYNTKFWTLPPSELTCEWLDGLVPVPSAEQTMRGASMRDPAEYGYNVEFLYPSRGGLGAVLEAFLRRVPQIQLGKRLIRLDTRTRRLYFSDKTVVPYEQLLCSIPLPQLKGLLEPLPPQIARALDVLRWTSVTVVHLGVRGKPKVPWHWAYMPDPELPFYRVGFPASYAQDAAPEGHHIISAEISHTPWSHLDREELVPRVIAGLQQLGLLRAEEDIVVRHPIELRYGYPIYDRNYAWATTLLREYLLEQGVRLIGRFGSWRYLSMEQTMLDGQQAAARVALDSHATVLA